MHEKSPLYATVAVTDLQRAKQFYADKLGLAIQREMPGVMSFSAGEGTALVAYERSKPPISDSTSATFIVPDVEREVDELIGMGITFEQYPELGTNDKGVSTMGSTKAAWFKDPDGNIIAITQIGE